MTPKTGKFSIKSIIFSDFSIIFLLFSLHIALALFAVYGRHLSITADAGRNYWDYFWQTLPIECLKNNTFESLWYFHAQPPLYNLLGASFIKGFGDHFLSRIHLFYTLLGALTGPMMYSIGKDLFKTRIFALVIALIWICNPALPLYEAYMLYDLPTLFLLLTGTFFLTKWAQNTKKNVYLGLFSLIMNILMLFRSLFHAVLLPFLWIFVLILPQKHKLRLFLTVFAISCMTVGWYAKNQAQFGFFGSSSWSGMNHWRLVFAYYTPEELNQMVEDGILDPMVTHIEAFERPSAYTAYGYTNTSNVAVLDLDDYNNINIPDISSTYGKNAVSLIQHDPTHYLHNIHCAYRIFCMPPTLFKHFDANTWKIQGWHDTWNNFFYGYNLLKRENWQDGFNSWLYFLIPASFLLFLIHFFRKTHLNPKNIAIFIQNEPVYVFLAAITAYTILIGILFELGENHRIQFVISPLLLLFIPSGIIRFFKN